MNLKALLSWCGDQQLPSAEAKLPLLCFSYCNLLFSLKGRRNMGHFFCAPR
jgi:hypothetical protein